MKADTGLNLMSMSRSKLYRNLGVLVLALVLGIASGYLTMFSWGVLLLFCWPVSTLLVCGLADGWEVPLGLVPNTVATAIITVYNIRYGPPSFYVGLLLFGIILSLAVSIPVEHSKRRKAGL